MVSPRLLEIFEIGILSYLIQDGSSHVRRSPVDISTGKVGLRAINMFILSIASYRCLAVITDGLEVTCMFR